MAPPSGTATRTRQLSEAPLRSARYPAGLPHLSQDASLKVAKANKMYVAMADFCTFLTQRGVMWSVEHPRRSYLWELPEFVALQAHATFYDFHACMHGGLRDKQVSFLSNCNLSELCLSCDGHHTHAPWSSEADEPLSIITSEAEYPLLLCQRLANIVLQHAVSQGFVVPSNLMDVVGKPCADIATHHQPRKSMPQLIPEFKRTEEIEVTDLELPLDGKACLQRFIRGFPCGSKRLRTGYVQDDRKTRCFVLLGVYRTEQEFVERALSLQHPFDMFCDVPDCMLRLNFFMLTSGPVELTRRRISKITQWPDWRNNLLKDEQKLHQSLEPGVAKILQGKNLLLLEKIASTLDWPDVNVFDEIKAGFRLVGLSEKSGVFFPKRSASRSCPKHS